MSSLISTLNECVSIERFVTPLDDKFKCPICWEVIHKPTQCPQGHVFCFKCIHTVANQPRCKCPMDRLFFSKAQLQPNIFVQDCINDLIITCKHGSIDTDGSSDDFCQYTGPLSSMEVHEKDICVYRLVNCSNIGCTFGPVQFRNLNDHLLVCPHRVVTCRHCSVDIIHYSASEHELQCDFAPVMCPNNCSTELVVLRDHAPVCPLEMVDCPLFQLNCCRVSSVSSSSSTTTSSGGGSGSISAMCNGRLLRRDLTEHVGSPDALAHTMIVLCGHIRTLNDKYEATSRELDMLRMVSSSTERSSAARLARIHHQAVEDRETNRIREEAMGNRPESTNSGTYFGELATAWGAMGAERSGQLSESALLTSRAEGHSNDSTFMQRLINVRAANAAQNQQSLHNQLAAANIMNATTNRNSEQAPFPRVPRLNNSSLADVSSVSRSAAAPVSLSRPQSASHLGRRSRQPDWFDDPLAFGGDAGESGNDIQTSRRPRLSYPPDRTGRTLRTAPNGYTTYEPPYASHRLGPEYMQRMLSAPRSTYYGAQHQRDTDRVPDLIPPALSTSYAQSSTSTSSNHNLTTQRLQRYPSSRASGLMAAQEEPLRASTPTRVSWRDNSTTGRLNITTSSASSEVEHRGSERESREGVLQTYSELMRSTSPYQNIAQRIVSQGVEDSSVMAQAVRSSSSSNLNALFSTGSERPLASDTLGSISSPPLRRSRGQHSSNGSVNNTNFTRTFAPSDLLADIDFSVFERGEEEDEEVLDNRSSSEHSNVMVTAGDMHQVAGQWRPQSTIATSIPGQMPTSGSSFHASSTNSSSSSSSGSGSSSDSNGMEVRDVIDLVDDDQSLSFEDFQEQLRESQQLSRSSHGPPPLVDFHESEEEEEVQQQDEDEFFTPNMFEDHASDTSEDSLSSENEADLIRL